MTTQLISPDQATFGKFAEGDTSLRLSKLAALAATNPRPQVAPTLAGAHLTPPSDAQHEALRTAAAHGRVYRGGQPGEANTRTLNALARKRLLHLTAHPGSRRADWAYGEITDRGRLALAELEAGVR